MSLLYAGLPNPLSVSISAAQHFSDRVHQINFEALLSSSDHTDHTGLEGRTSGGEWAWLPVMEQLSYGICGLNDLCEICLSGTRVWRSSKRLG